MRGGSLLTRFWRTQPEWKDVVPMFSIINEAIIKTIGQDQMTSLCVSDSFFASRYIR